MDHDETQPAPPVPAVTAPNLTAMPQVPKASHLALRIDALANGWLVVAAISPNGPSDAHVARDPKELAALVENWAFSQRFPSPTSGPQE